MKERLNRIDEIRGFTLISMIIYHFMWDLQFIALIEMDWYTGPIGYVWQKSICITFIFISGFCFSLGKKRFKRSIIVFFAGALVTAVTLAVMPENRVVFGVLTFIGTMGLITIPINFLHKKLETILDKKTINLTLLLGNLLLFIAFFKVNYGELFLFIKKIDIPKFYYDGYLATFLGFTDPYFFSTDYFSIFPWAFLYLMGYYFNQLLVCLENRLCEHIFSFLKDDRFKKVSFIGRHTLFIYLIHQPVLYLITLLIINIKK